MRTLRYSLVFFLFSIPFGACAESRIEIPTTIQVVDEAGHTRVSTDTPQRPQESRMAPQIIPRECVDVLKTPPNRTPSLSIPENHPLRTRIESQRAVLSSLVTQLSFSPEFSRTEEEALKEALSAFGTGVLSTSTPLTCLSLLQISRGEPVGIKQYETVERISDVARGLQYGLRSFSNKQHDAPKDSIEALYAGDILLSQKPSVRSLSITEGSVRMSVLFPIRMFWGTHATATVVVFSDGKKVRADTPWWSIFGKPPFSKIQDQLSGLPPQQPSYEGMYLRAKDIVEALPS